MRPNSRLGVMSKTLPVQALLEDWLKWATWVADPLRREEDAQNLTGWMEFDWVVDEEPEKGRNAILAALENPRIEVHLGTLAAGPLEDLLSKHDENFIGRVEAEAKSNPKFAWFLGGVWRYQMTEEVWNRVQLVWDRGGWVGNPKRDA